MLKRLLFLKLCSELIHDILTKKNTTQQLHASVMSLNQKKTQVKKVNNQLKD